MVCPNAKFAIYLRVGKDRLSSLPRTKNDKPWSCQNMPETVEYILDNIYIRFGTKLYKQTVGIPVDTDCASVVADLFLFCYERNFITLLSNDEQVEIIEALHHLHVPWSCCL